MNAAGGYGGYTPLHEAIWHNDSLAVVEALLAAGANVDSINDNGATVLQSVVQAYDNLAVVKTLLAVGANVDATDNNGATPLHDAIR